MVIRLSGTVFRKGEKRRSADLMRMGLEVG